MNMNKKERKGREKILSSVSTFARKQSWERGLPPGAHLEGGGGGNVPCPRPLLTLQ